MLRVNHLLFQILLAAKCTLMPEITQSGNLETNRVLQSLTLFLTSVNNIGEEIALILHKLIIELGHNL